MRQLHAIWLLVTTGITALAEVGNMIIDGTKIKFRSETGPAGVRTVLDDSDIVSTLGGNETDKVPSAAAVKSAVDGVALTVNPNSTSYLTIQAGQIEVRPLLVTRPIIDSVSVDLVTALAARTPVYNLANVTNTSADLQTGDFIILPLHTGGLRVFLHNGGIAGGVGDFTLVEQPLLDTATIRALLTAVNGLTYNNFTGQFKLGGTLTESTTIETSTFPFAITRNEGLSTNEFSINPSTKSSLMKGGAGSVNIGQTGFTIAIGAFATSNGATILDQRSGTNKTGLQYQSDYSANFVARSIVDKAYVDAQITANTTGKANPTVNTTAGVWTTVPHNFDFTVGNFDNLIVTMFDSSGVGVVAPFRTKDKDNIEVLTAESVTGLKVRMLKTL